MGKLLKLLSELLKKAPKKGPKPKTNPAKKAKNEFPKRKPSATELCNKFVDKLLNDPKSIWGKSPEEIRDLFQNAGYKTVIESGKKGSKLSKQIRIEGHPKITNIQYHPGGGRHGGSYYKISTSTKGKIKVVDRATYKPTTGEKTEIIYKD
ncbi:hypothetical protein PN36_33885 [Candidatus Thiomargarita nelsonii]|uniref:Uncharacterized protein n=1 Tax=Candidatus Thiomargarita nelsonii TaxID=1003181 RepID=A0A4E0QKI1_9GAMM|nr:hypothetical protein PN36_33885 [Candidatus Thiomargarita nelsonii]